jgi:hypothetical protein
LSGLPQPAKARGSCIAAAYLFLYLNGKWRSGDFILIFDSALLLCHLVIWREDQKNSISGEMQEGRKKFITKFRTTYP